MQITPATGEWIAGKIGMTGFTPTDLYEPETNVRFGTWYLRYLLDRFSGDVATALLAYNAGPGAAERWAKGNEGVYPETAAYLEAVQRAERAYRALYSSLLLGGSSASSPDRAYFSSYISLILRVSIFPVAALGRESTNTILRGFLNEASSFSTCAMISSSVSV